MSRINCPKGCSAIMVQVKFDLYCATNVPAWSCSQCGKWVYSEQVRHVYMNQIYVATTTRRTYEEHLENFLREGR